MADSFLHPFQADSDSERLRQAILANLMQQSTLYQQVSAQSASINVRLSQIYNEISQLQLRSKKSVPCKRHLYDSLNISGPFDMSLCLRGTFPNPICKGKYFTFSVSVADFCLPEPEKIRLNLVVFSADNPPIMLSENMNGQKILRGNSKPLLVYRETDNLHSAFFKIQLTEVTSHLKNGWVFFVVFPDERSDFLAKTAFHVQPLVIEHVVCKAKEITCERWREKGRVRNIQPE